MKLFLLACLVLLASVAVAKEEEFTSFFYDLSTFNEYNPERVPDVPSISLPTILVVDTDDSSAPFGLLTFSREGAIPTFDLPPVSYFRTSLFGRGPGGNEYVVESSVAGNQNDSPASVLTASVAFAVMMVMILV